MKKIIGVLVGVSLLGMLFSGSFLGTFFEPEPHGVPVAVVGPDTLVNQLSGAMEDNKPGGFDLREYTSVDVAHEALLGREVDAVLVPQEGRLVVASAGGRAGAAAITGAFQAAEKAQGRALRVEDAVPLAAGDVGGTSGMFYVLSLVLPGLAMALLLTKVAPGHGPALRVGVMVAGALVAASVNAWLADVVLGALPGRYGWLVVVSAGIVLTIGLVVSGLLKTVGTVGLVLAALLFIPIGLPASGGPIGARFIPEWYAAIGRFLPVEPGSEVVRNTVYFDGAALGTPLGVLAAWALLGVILLALPRRRTSSHQAAHRIRR
ncbi:hypothetical protein ACQP2T_57370 [Nonomuraea sp. CA-143628]|uniref:hypothetical protein n=1 Tax=Nonomuraea sp. CA-143628 TaxID=3239997 RepID=UPI003D8E2283